MAGYSKGEVEKHTEYADDNGYQIDNKGRRYSAINGEHFDDKGRRFSGYDPTGRRVSVVDDVFGEIKEGGPNYRDVSCAVW